MYSYFSVCLACTHQSLRLVCILELGRSVSHSISAFHFRLHSPEHYMKEAKKLKHKADAMVCYMLVQDVQLSLILRVKESKWLVVLFSPWFPSPGIASLIAEELKRWSIRVLVYMQVGFISLLQRGSCCVYNWQSVCHHFFLFLFLFLTSVFTNKKSYFFLNGTFNSILLFLVILKFYNSCTKKSYLQI